MNNRVPPVIPNFTLIEICGRGGSSEVWFAADPNGIRRAIRIMDKTRFSDEFRLESESKAVSVYRNIANQHPNLLDILYTGETPEYLYYVTELADNVNSFPNQYEADTLAWRIKNRKESRKIILSYLEAILNGVEQLHRYEIAHHDLKPENIIFVKGVLKIADPGLIASSNKKTLGGTPGFRPSWHLSGIEADIYAIGKIIYCLMTKEDPTRFPEIPPECPIEEFAELNEIALKCCEREPEERYHSIAEIRRDLAAVREPVKFLNRFEGMRTKSSMILAVLLCISLIFNLLPFMKGCFQNKISKTEAQQLIDITYQNMNSMTLKELDTVFTLLDHADPDELTTTHEYRLQQLDEYAGFLRNMQANDAAGFAIPLLISMSIFPDKETHAKYIYHYISLNPSAILSPHTLARCYMFHIRNGSRKFAEETLRRLKQCDFSQYNNYAAAFELLQLVNFMTASGDFENALFFTEKAEKLAPNYAPVYMILFQIHYKKQEYDKAEEAFRKYRELHPQSCCIEMFYEMLTRKQNTKKPGENPG
ncbi:MAG: protein kinase [Lentisphaeria bacterium]|nr:protein kinase [Lentisphaeria bacterium]